MYVNCSSEVFPSCPDTARPAELFTGDQATIALFNNARIATPALRGCIKGFRKAGRRTRHDRGFRRLSDGCNQRRRIGKGGKSISRRQDGRYRRLGLAKWQGKEWLKDVKLARAPNS